MKLGSIDGEGDGEYNNVGFVGISEYLWHRMIFLIGTAPFDSVFKK